MKTINQFTASSRYLIGHSQWDSNNKSLHTSSIKFSYIQCVQINIYLLMYLTSKHPISFTDKWFTLISN